ncbi:hypothetical protein KY349_06035 [Candidatus Woesearchaeota archaeon]|nr:hypothetical protein [Candidatus Woesearchaeota archaeon]
MAAKVAPLKSSFMLIAMLGFMITVVYTAYGRISTDWGFALGFVFALMFVASVIAMTHAPIETQLEMAPEFFKQPKKKARRRRKRPSRARPAKRKAAKKK